MSATFSVKFYRDRTPGKKAGTFVAYFATRAEADAFAAGKRMYARPAVVTEMEPLSVEQTRIALKAVGQ